MTNPFSYAFEKFNTAVRLLASDERRLEDRVQEAWREISPLTRGGGSLGEDVGGAIQSLEIHFQDTNYPRSDVAQEFVAVYTRIVQEIERSKP